MAFDKGKAHSLYVVPGLASVIKFPCFVADALSGDESQVSVRFSPTTKKELQISMKSSFSRPTNLIVRCEGQGDHFVFDLIPSKTTHQDILELRMSYGRAEMMDFKELTKESFETKESLENSINKQTQQIKKIVIQAPKLIESNIENKSPEIKDKENK